ncbi:MAG: von Willebrand factor type A domain-containing protein [Bacteroidetes bacterium]|nr:von Willebrand factor type A domain-containing protein [Bacteroidota bacterium]
MFKLSSLLLLVSASMLSMSFTPKKIITPACSVYGKVSDNSNNEEIPFANVQLFKQDKTVAATVTTDMLGEYCLKNIPAGIYNITVTYVGYTSKTIKSIKLTEAGNLKLDIKLSASAEMTLEEVEIKTKEPAAKANQTISMGKMHRKDVKAGYFNVTTSSADFNTEEYAKIDDNEFKDSKKNPLSTFSIDVDKASYSNIRRFISQGNLPPEDAVRIEEMVNYFSYNYPQPKGNDPFSITTQYMDCPWNKQHNLIHIGLQGKEIKLENTPANNLVFLIDVSGSMNDHNKLPLLKSGLRLLVDQMRTQDKVAIVVYAGAAGIVLQSTSDKGKILDALEQLEAGGSTAGGEGILLAYKTAKENFLKSGNNRIILATDGDFNVGASSDGELVRIIEKEREAGVFLTVLGFGSGNYKDSKMEQLADKGNGNYAYIDNILEAKKVLVKEMGGTLLTIAKDVKIQIEFNPAKVKAYRLVGYENRLLNTEDFNDDKKDAGELGAGHSVTAIYEIIPVGSTELVASVDELKYQQNMPIKSTNNEVMTIKFRYKAPKDTVSQLITETMQDKKLSIDNVSDDCRFAIAVAEFGMLLRDSKFKGEANYKNILAQARSSKGKDEEGYRAEFIRLVETAELLKK